MDKQFVAVLALLVVLVGLQFYQIADFAVQPTDEVDDYWLDCPKALDSHLRELGYVYSAGYVADCQMHDALVVAGIMEEVVEDVNSSG